MAGAILTLIEDAEGFVLYSDHEGIPAEVRCISAQASALDPH